MSEENDKKIDAVSTEDHNKIIEAHNREKIEKAEIEKKYNELKQKVEKKEKVAEEKKEWETKMEEQNKVIEDLKKQVETKKEETKSPKGIVQETPKTEMVTADKIKTLLDEKIPNMDVNPKAFASNLARFKHYKSPTTKKYTEDQLAWVLSLDAGAQSNNPELIPKDARTNRRDLVLNND